MRISTVRMPSEAPEGPKRAGDSVNVQTVGRLLFIDNLRVLTIMLVVVAHVAVLYGGLSDEGPDGVAPGLIVSLALLWFTWVVQAFAMPLMFFISGYFTPGAYDRRTPFTYLRDRLIRLGIPLLIYDLLINPLLVYSATPTRLPISEFWRNYPAYIIGFGTGPMWYVLNLLLFSLGYLAWRLLTPRLDSSPDLIAAPTHRSALGLLLGMAVATFLVRLVWPVGWGNFFSLRLPYLPAYLGAFVLGVWAWRGGWLAAAVERLGRPWLRVGILGALLFPALLAMGDLSMLGGGMRVPSLVFALWEATVGIGLGLGLLYHFSRHHSTQGLLARSLSSSAYMVYIIHVPVIWALRKLLGGLPLGPLLLFVLISGLAVPLCFVIGHYALRGVPLLRRVF